MNKMINGTGVPSLPHCHDTCRPYLDAGMANGLLVTI